MTITHSEWRRLGRRHRRDSVDRGCTYLYVRCDVQGRVRVRAMIVPDGSPEARGKVSA